MPTPNPLIPSTLSRRDFLSHSAAGATALALGLNSTSLQAADASSTPKVAFFVVGDTHYLADKESPARMDAHRKRVAGLHMPYYSLVKL